ncbi:MAG: lysophospholipid acyltransferase family protein [Candidatus Kaelpia aquatica]|nr:lysophospholipid acyltransferase family protein [Candidatus Kaelpia aquatica]
MILNRLLSLMGLLIAKILFLLRIEGKNNVPLRGAVIIASNHASFLDPILLGAASRRVLNFMAKEELFHLGIFSKLISNVGTLPIKRGALSKSTIKQALRFLNQGRALVVFPEGSRSRDGEIGKGESGVVWLARATEALIVPVKISGTDKALGVNSTAIRPYPVKVAFGKPLKLSDLEGEDLESMSDSLMERIKRL